jgi:beta-xylosidase
MVKFNLNHYTMNIKIVLLYSIFIFSLLSCQNTPEFVYPTTFCNPMNLDYGWGKFQTTTPDVRSAADPVIVLFKDKYYLFTTMDFGGYRVSDDLITWKKVYFNKDIRKSALNGNYYTAPAAATDGDYLYFTKFNRDRGQKTTDIIRSANPESGKWEKCGEIRRMADPTLLIDDGRFFFYYGLGADQSTTVFEIDPSSYSEIQGTDKVLREYITDVNQCISGYHFGRRELYDEIDASDWIGKFKWLPCPEGAWVIKHNDTYYLQYATPGTICQWYCDVAMISDSPTGPFIEQVYNPVSLKVGGFIGSAGHSSVFRDKSGNWWQATTMWIGNHEPFERRIGLFPVSFDAQGRMRVHTVLGDYPVPLPKGQYNPKDRTIMDWWIQSFNKKCTASS